MAPKSTREGLVPALSKTSASRLTLWQDWSVTWAALLASVLRHIPRALTTAARGDPCCAYVQQREGGGGQNTRRDLDDMQPDELSNERWVGRK